MKKLILMLINILLIFIISTLIPCKLVIKDDFPIIIAHRGSMEFAPENTLVAFQKAMKDGCDAIELDVHLTKDNEVVVLHDNKLEHTTDGSGLVGTHTLAELKELDAGKYFSDKYSGTKIPTLTEAMELISKNNIMIFIDIKGNNDIIIKKVIEIISKFNYQWNTVITSFNKKYLLETKEIDPTIRTEFCFYWSSKDPIEYIEDLDIDMLCTTIYYLQFMPIKYRDSIKKRHIQLNVFDIDNIPSMLLILLNDIDDIDGIVTNNPYKLKKFYNRPIN